MNLIPAAVLTVLAILGGVVAYLGDWLGRKLGKKRLSLLGMRPRHTAGVFTFVAGALIPLLTVAIVIAVSQPVREWLLESAKVLKERDDAEFRLNRDKVALQQDQVSIQAFKNTQQADAREMQSTRVQLTGLRISKSQLENQISSANIKLALARRQLDSANRQVLLAKEQYKDAHERYLQVHQQYTTAQKSLASLQATYTTLQTQYVALRKDRDQVQAQRDALQQEIQAKQQEITQQTAELKQEQAELDATQTNLKQAQSELSSATAQLASTKDELQQMETRLQETVRRGSEEINWSRYVPVIFNVDEELGREYVPPDTNSEDARAILERLIAESNDSARAKGAQNKAPGGQDAGLIPLPLQNGKEETVEQVESSLVEAMAGKPYAQVAIARAYANTTVGEAVPLEVKVAKNPLIFRKNEQIAEGVIHGDLSALDIFREIESFVKDKVQTRARIDNMIPAGPDQSFGEIPAEEVFTLVDKIHEWGRSVRLVALAKEDIHAADALDLKFDLRQ